MMVRSPIVQMPNLNQASNYQVVSSSAKLVSFPDGSRFGKIMEHLTLCLLPYYYPLTYCDVRI